MECRGQPLGSPGHLRSSFFAPMTRFFDSLVTNFTRSGLGGAGLPWIGSFGFPTWWDTEISSRDKGSWILIRSLQSLSTFSCVEPGVCLESPKIQIESLGPCCSWLSTAGLSWTTSPSSAWILFSFSSPSFFNTWTVWTVSANFWVTGYILYCDAKPTPLWADDNIHIKTRIKHEFWKFDRLKKDNISFYIYVDTQNRHAHIKLLFH